MVWAVSIRVSLRVDLKQQLRTLGLLLCCVCGTESPISDCPAFPPILESLKGPEPVSADQLMAGVRGRMRPLLYHIYLF
jgi:hypothetical protein